MHGVSLLRDSLNLKVSKKLELVIVEHVHKNFKVSGSRLTKSFQLDRRWVRSMRGVARKQLAYIAFEIVRIFGHKCDFRYEMI